MTESTAKYVVIPLHHRPDLIRDCCKLLNSEWPRSETARCVMFPLVLKDGLQKNRKNVSTNSQLLYCYIAV